MEKIYIKLTLVLALLFGQLSWIHTATAEVTIDRMANERIFALQFPRGLAFYGAVNRISSVSLQEYLSGPYVVTEVVIDLAGGPSQLRIYVTEIYDPVAAADRVARSLAPGEGSTRPSGGPIQAATDRVRRTVQSVKDDIVVKEYPAATHAQTIEYRLAKRDTLIQLFETFVHLWDGTGVELVSDGAVESLDRLNGIRFIVTND